MPGLHFDSVLFLCVANSARSQIEKMYGKDYLPSSPRVYKNKVKNAQEAHEAIRPAGDVFKLPEQVARQVDSDEAKLYELIWKRTIASQMADSRGESISVRINAKAKDGRDALFSVFWRKLSICSGGKLCRNCWASCESCRSTKSKR